MAASISAAHGSVTGVSLIATARRAASQRLLMASRRTTRCSAVVIVRAVAHVDFEWLVAVEVAGTIATVTVVVVLAVAEATRRRSVHGTVASRRASILRRRHVSSDSGRMTRRQVFPIIVRIKVLRQLGLLSRTALRCWWTSRCIVGVIVLPEVLLSPWRSLRPCSSVGEARIFLIASDDMIFTIRVRGLLLGTLLLIALLFGSRLTLVDSSRLLVLPKMKLDIFKRSIHLLDFGLLLLSGYPGSLLLFHSIFAVLLLRRGLGDWLFRLRSRCDRCWSAATILHEDAGLGLLVADLVGHLEEHSRQSDLDASSVALLRSLTVIISLENDLLVDEFRELVQERDTRLHDLDNLEDLGNVHLVALDGDAPVFSHLADAVVDDLTHAHPRVDLDVRGLLFGRLLHVHLGHVNELSLRFTSRWLATGFRLSLDRSCCVFRLPHR